MMMGMGRQAPPKGNIDLLWELLGVQIEGQQAVWQEYSPIRQLPGIPMGFVFLDQSSDITPFAQVDPVTSALQYMMLPFPGRITEHVPFLGARPESPLTVTPLLQTFQQPSGIVLSQLVLAELVRQQLPRGTWESRMVSLPNETQELAVRIRGELPPPPARELQEGEMPVRPVPTQIDVILVADVDMLSDTMFALRRIGSDPGAGIDLNFDNVTFVLNAIDSVAGDERFIEIRSRRPRHRTLSKFDEHTDGIRAATMEARRSLQAEFETIEQEAERAFEARMQQLEREFQRGGMDQREAVRRVTTAMTTGRRQIETERDRLQRQLNIELAQAEVRLNEEVRRIQGQYKLWSVVLPPIPPLLIALAVFFVRRIRESEGIPVSRRRK